MTGLVKSFTATLALDHVDFDLRRGEVHALLGQNGAGKSTLIKVLAGVYPPDSGEILLDGRPVQPRFDRLPISFIHQDLGLVEWMTIAENVAIQAGYPRTHFGLISWRRAHEAAARALAIMGSDLDPATPVAALPAAERSLVAIGRALAVKSDILVLDEPTAALPEADVERLLETLRRLQVERHRHHLCYASARRGLSDRGPRHGPSRRKAGRHCRHAGDRSRRSRQDDRRQIDERCLRAARAGVGERRAFRQRRRRGGCRPGEFRSSCR